MTVKSLSGPTLTLMPGDISAQLSLPLRVQVQGIEAVLVSAAAYDEFLRASQRSVGSQSRIARDPDLKAFIDERLSTHEMGAILEEALMRFGADRVPSSSALGRYAIERRRVAKALTAFSEGQRGSRSSA